MSKLGVGLIGCGGMGRSLASQLITLENATLVGVTDSVAETATKASVELGAPAVGSVDELLARDDLDAVLIAAPPFQHRPLTEQAAAAGKHVFVEKPMAANTGDCDAMAAATEEAGVLLQVGQVLRFYPCWWRIIDLVNSGAIGKPNGIIVTRIGGGWGQWSVDWRNSLEKSGGLLMEVNAHEIDFMCQICGDVERVYAEADHYGDDPSDFPNLLFVSLRFSSGAVGLLHSSQVSALNELSGKIQGETGAIFYDSGFGGGTIRVGQREGETESLPISEIEIEQPVRHELRLFVEAVQSGGPSPVPASEGRRNVAVAQAAYQSAREGRPIHL